MADAHYATAGAEAGKGVGLHYSHFSAIGAGPPLKIHRFAGVFPRRFRRYSEIFIKNRASIESRAKNAQTKVPASGKVIARQVTRHQ